MSKDPKLAGVVGWPIAHSLSPLIHTIWAARNTIDAYYVPLAIPPAYDQFAGAMGSLKTLGFKGVNVTLPHKAHALRYSDRASERAKQAGAANMLTFGADGVTADNSDIEGFCGAIAGALDQAPKKNAALILGAGGAAPAIILALKALGFGELQIANRTETKAEDLAVKFDLKPVSWTNRHDALAGADLVVNTTSLGMVGQPPLALKLDQLKDTAAVADIVYAPLETPLLLAARQRGCKTVDGLTMLMHQAAPGAKAWFGADPQIDADLRAALIEELARRETL